MLKASKCRNGGKGFVQREQNERNQKNRSERVLTAMNGVRNGTEERGRDMGRGRVIKASIGRICPEKAQRQTGHDPDPIMAFVSAKVCTRCRGLSGLGAWRLVKTAIRCCSALRTSLSNGMCEMPVEMIGVEGKQTR